MIPGQPRNDPVTIAGFHAMGVAGEIGEQGFVRHRDAVRKARRTARILQIGDIGRLRLWQRHIRRCIGEIDRPVMGRAQPLRGLADHGEQAFGRQHHLGVATAQLRGDLVDIGFAAAKTGRQRQRHRQGAGIDGGKKGSGKARAGFGDQRDPVTGLDPGGNQTPCLRPRIGSEFCIGIGAHQIGASIVKIHPLVAKRCIIKRFTQGAERGTAPRQRIEGRRRRQQGRYFVQACVQAHNSLFRPHRGYLPPCDTDIPTPRLSLWQTGAFEFRP